MSFFRCGISDKGAEADSVKEISNNYITTENDAYIAAVVSAFAVKTGGGNTVNHTSTVSCGSKTLSLYAVAHNPNDVDDKGGSTAVWSVLPGQVVSISTYGVVNSGAAGYHTGIAKAFVIKK